MTLNACQLYLKNNVLNTVQGPLPPWNTRVCLPYIQPPVPGVLQIAQPHIYIWGASWQDRRIALPRSGAPGNPPGTSGWKSKKYMLDLYLIADTPIQGATAPYPDSAFELLINALEATLHNALMPQPLTDPVTGEVSQFFDLGEIVNGSFDVPRTMADQRFLRYLCRLTCQITENFQD